MSHSTPARDGYAEMTAADVRRFWSKVKKTDGGCWEWLGSTDSRGYGQFRARGKTLRAHRVAWFLTRGPLPRDRFVCHHCDNRRCCNVEAHLFAGTNADNVRDMDAKGRRVNAPRYGEDHHASRLTKDDVIAIRELHQNGRTYDNLAEWFGVSRSTIAAASVGRNWRWL